MRFIVCSKGVGRADWSSSAAEEVLGRYDSMDGLRCIGGAGKRGTLAGRARETSSKGIQGAWAVGWSSTKRACTAARGLQRGREESGRRGRGGRREALGEREDGMGVG